VCIQESKIERVEASLIKFALGSAYDNNFVYLPIEGTRRRWGVIIAADNSIMKLSNPVTTNHTLSATIHDSHCSIPWQITRLYGPQGDLEKKIFLREVRQARGQSNLAFIRRF
jgi:hypothetical protein